MYAGISSSRKTPINAMDDEDRIIGTRKVVAHSRRRIRGAIIDQYDFMRWESLSKDTVHALRQILLDVVNRDNHGNTDSSLFA